MACYEARLLSGLVFKVYRKHRTFRVCLFSLTRVAVRIQRQPCFPSFLLAPLFIFFQPRVSRSDVTPLYPRNKLPSARLGTAGVPHRCFASSFRGPTTMTPAP